MYIWENAVITRKGLSLLSKLSAGNTLSLTRAASGSSYEDPDMLKNMTIMDEEQDLTFMAISYPEEGACAVPVRLTNEGLAAGYLCTQIGVYAFDPDEGEILFLLAQANDTEGTKIPSATEMPGYSAEWTIKVVYGYADGVEVTVDPSHTVSSGEVSALIEQHNTSTTPHAGVLTKQADFEAHIGNKNNPHGVTKTQLGLGNVDNTADSEKYVEFARTSGTANKAKNAIIIRLNGGRDEGSTMFTYDGSVAKSVNINAEKLGAASAEDLTDHINNKNNPHGITAEQLGLGNVSNTKDSEKSVKYAEEAGHTANALSIALNGGTEEDTNLFTFDGSARKAINLTPASLGITQNIEDTQYPGCYYHMVGDEKEWVNPPMIKGKEYRTTQRHKGQPVYAAYLEGYCNAYSTAWTDTPSISTAVDQVVEVNGSVRWRESTEDYYVGSLQVNGSNIVVLQGENSISLLNQNAVQKALEVFVVVKYTKELT